MPPSQFDLIVHSTHEAGWQVGGIGAVLNGLLGEPAYNRAVKRTILVGPFRQDDPLERERLYAPRNGLKVRFSSLDGVADVRPGIARALQRVERDHNVRVLYGTRRFGAAEHEIVLVDPSAVDRQRVADFKYHLWQQYGINSYDYEWSPEYDWHVSAAEPSFAALQAVAGAGRPLGAPTSHSARGARAAIIAHDWLGLPLAFSARRNAPARFRLVYYAHEVSAARVLVEWHPGHDTRFYNVMDRARRLGLSLEDVFGSQLHSFKHALLLAASDFDGFLAVSDLTLDELRFLSPGFARHPLARVYNGVPSPAITLRDKQTGKTRLRQYASNLLGYKPTWVFTHVSRLILSKALWRDVRILEQLDPLLAARGETAVLFTLATSSPSGKRREDVLRWESEYGWPVTHRSDNGDLVDFEVDYYNVIVQFNRTARACQIVLVNQFGFDRNRCGVRVPRAVEPADIRRGTDVEFGQSIYEPFGIGQLEPLAAGALCCLSSVCGSVGFVRQETDGGVPNVLVSDYVTLPSEWEAMDMQALTQLGQAPRDQIEMREAARAAQELFARLPRTNRERQALLDQGQALCRRMSWRVVVERGLLPALLELFRVR